MKWNIDFEKKSSNRSQSSSISSSAVVTGKSSKGAEEGPQDLGHTHCGSEAGEKTRNQDATDDTEQSHAAA